MFTVELSGGSFRSPLHTYRQTACDVPLAPSELLFSRSLGLESNPLSFWIVVSSRSYRKWYWERWQNMLFPVNEFKIIAIGAAVLSWRGSHHLFCTDLNCRRNYVLDKYEKENDENAWTSVGRSDRTVEGIIWLLFRLWLCIKRIF